MSRDPLSHEPSFVDRHDHSEAPARRSPVSEDPRYGPVEESEPRRSSDPREGPETDNAVRGYYMRERTYILRESEFRTLVEIGKFRVVEASDLAQFGYAGDARRMSRDLRRLEQQSLVARESLYSTRGAKQVLVLTKRAKKLLED